MPSNSTTDVQALLDQIRDAIKHALPIVQQFYRSKVPEMDAALQAVVDLRAALEALLPKDSGQLVPMTDTARLDYLENNSVMLMAHESPTGGGDYDTAWEVVEYHMRDPKPHVLGFGNTPRDAIDDAMAKEPL